MNAKKLERMIEDHSVDPMLSLAYKLRDMGMTRNELQKLCQQLPLIPDPTKNKLENFFRDITLGD